jgi:hypothetical protein
VHFGISNIGHDVGEDLGGVVQLVRNHGRVDAGVVQLDGDVRHLLLDGLADLVELESI